MSLKILANGFVFTPDAVVKDFGGMLDMFIYGVRCCTARMTYQNIIILSLGFAGESGVPVLGAARGRSGLGRAADHVAALSASSAHLHPRAAHAPCRLRAVPRVQGDLAGKRSKSVTVC